MYFENKEELENLIQKVRDILSPLVKFEGLKV
ncbi:MAG: hypothetical protein XD52_0341, partial [bacterium 42_11]